MLKLGNIELHPLSDGHFRLDGGAMFGIVPKPLWEKLSPADARNRIELSLNPLLIKTPAKNILVDTGIGTKHDARFSEMYAIDHRWTLPESLKEVGLTTAEIDYVIPSHMHFDHMGGATIKEGGSIVPTFPKATFLVQRKEWEAAFLENPRSKGSYIPDDYLPIEKRVKLLDGDEEIVPGVCVRHTNAHTQGHQVTFIEQNGLKAVYLGDLMPTSAHLKPAWCMGYDLFPLEVARIKQQFLEQAAREGWIIIFDHDLSMKMARVKQEERGYTLERIES
jgi:glyoxylase-like metal-dependent hydrolase (beta-lactamase superfamily II)